jgi:hypothetical protein
MKGKRMSRGGRERKTRKENEEREREKNDKTRKDDRPKVIHPPYCQAKGTREKGQKHAEENDQQ